MSDSEDSSRLGLPAPLAKCTNLWKRELKSLSSSCCQREITVYPTPGMDKAYKHDYIAVRFMYDMEMDRPLWRSIQPFMAYFVQQNKGSMASTATGMGLNGPWSTKADICTAVLESFKHGGPVPAHPQPPSLSAPPKRQLAQASTQPTPARQPTQQPMLTLARQPTQQPTLAHQPAQQPRPFHQASTKPMLFSQPTQQPRPYHQASMGPPLLSQASTQPPLFGQPTQQPRHFYQASTEPTLFGQRPKAMPARATQDYPGRPFPWVNIHGEEYAQTNAATAAKPQDKPSYRIYPEMTEPRRTKTEPNNDEIYFPPLRHQQRQHTTSFLPHHQGQQLPKSYRPPVRQQQQPPLTWEASQAPEPASRPVEEYYRSHQVPQAYPTLERPAPRRGALAPSALRRPVPAQLPAPASQYKFGKLMDLLNQIAGSMPTQETQETYEV